MIIKTKLNVPAISKTFVQRENIARKLQSAADCKLILLAAPAGFGKTTTAANYLFDKQIPHAWFSIDEEDNDPVNFWKYMISTLAGFMNDPGSVEDMPVNEELISSGILSGLIIDQLYGTPGTMLVVLDDFHLIHNELVRKSFAYFIKYLPANIKVVILSRRDLDHTLSHKYVGGRVLKIGAEDLSFNADEISIFFHNRGLSLTAEELVILEKYTEGWAAGLVVSALSLESSRDVHAAVRQLSGRNRYIDSFIRNEVFDNWSGEIKEFLVRTSFLDKLCGPLCKAVTGSGDASGVLMRLAEGNSLVFHLDEENQWYRYHHLFKEFLYHKLEEEDKVLLSDLFLRAGVWYRENGLNRYAIDSFIKAGAYREAITLLVNRDIYLDMAQNGELAKWCKWTAMIPEDVYPEGYTKEKVQAFIAIAWNLSMENRLEEASLWIEKAEASFKQLCNADESEIQYLNSHILIARAVTHIGRMDPEQSLRCFEKLMGIELYEPILLGELNLCEPRLLNTIYGFKGRLNFIEGTYGMLLKEFPKIIGDFSAYATIIFAELQYERNDLDAAGRTLIQGMAPVLQLNNPGAVVPCFIALARLKKAEGDIPGAVRNIAAGRKQLEGRNKSFWNYYLNVFTADLYLDLLDTDAAEEWLDIGRIGIYDKLSCSREYEYIVYARYLILKREYDDAILLLNRLETFAENENRLGSLVRIRSLMAIGYHLKDDSKSAFPILEKALEPGLEHGYTRTFLDELEPMATLLKEYRSRMSKRGEADKYSYAGILLRQVNNYIKLFRDKNPARENLWPVGDIASELLSPREYKVLRLLAAERSNSEIAAELYITIRTVKHYNSRLFEKLGVKNRFEAVMKAKELNLLN